ncbi:MAG TPA: hypothetical protein VHX61_15110 [Rhizomicrobium sp.]|jgi:hypothetical protein|nr:hypothetical protein [Rhizomicrobium sp.]
MNIGPEHHIEPPKLGHRWFDIAITVCILLVSVSSLIIAIVHSSTLERMADANARLVETNSWPFLGYGTGNAVGKSGSSIEMRITNNGVGPAKIEAAELKWNGAAQRNATGFLRACCGYRPNGTNGLWTDVIAGRVLRAGETITFLTLPQTPADLGAWKQLNQARLDRRLSLTVCYCSVFDECWTEDVVRLSLDPKRVDRCDASAVPYGKPF